MLGVLLHHRRPAVGSGSRRGAGLCVTQRQRLTKMNRHGRPNGRSAPGRAFCWAPPEKGKDWQVAHLRAARFTLGTLHRAANAALQMLPSGYAARHVLPSRYAARQIYCHTARGAQKTPGAWPPPCAWGSGVPPYQADLRVRRRPSRPMTETRDTNAAAPNVGTGVGLAGGTTVPLLRMMICAAGPSTV